MKSFEKAGDCGRDLRTRGWTKFQRVRSSPRDMAEEWRWECRASGRGERAKRGQNQTTPDTGPIQPASRASAMLRKTDPAEDRLQGAAAVKPTDYDQQITLGESFVTNG